MKYITDIIGDDYLSWKPEEAVLISTATGSGKSTFVLRKLLPHAIEQGKHILYLCNRRILKEQFATSAKNELALIFKDVGGIPEDMQHAIHVATYQRCETSKKFPNFDIVPDLSLYSREEIVRMERRNCLPEKKTVLASDILYCIFDEAHYLLSDSQFNARINFWSHAKLNNGCINIFLTATPDPLTVFLTSRSTKFDIDTYLREIHAIYKEKAALKKELSKPECSISVDMKSGTAIDNIHFLPQRKIDARCREIEPYTKAICSLKEKQQNLTLRTYAAQLFGDPYQNIYTHYFREWDDIFPQLMLATPENKWLVFVDRESDGLQLLGRLEQAGISSAFLTAESIKKPGAAREELWNITQHSYFTSRVLLATSVMDCGVSIVDPCVKNVILSQHNKTTFLQMLGRVRMLDDNSTFHLHLKFYSVKSINGVRHEYDTKLRYLTNFALLNRRDLIPTETATDKRDGLSSVSILSKSDRQQVIEDMQKPSNVPLIYGKAPYQNTTDGMLGEFEASQSAYMSLLFEISEYLDALNDYRAHEDPLFYLKRQLQWINKEYSEENWVWYQETRDKLIEYLENQVDRPMMTDDEKAKCSQRCFQLFAAFPVPPNVWKNDMCRFGKGARLPGLKLLNSALKEKDIPYIIASKQKTYNGKRVTVWSIQKTN